MVQFPQQLPTGMERPYFLQGDPRRPAYLWRWRSDMQQAEELIATGLGTGNPQDVSGVQVQVQSSFSDGEWRVLFRRPLATPDSAADLQIPLAQAVPIAFQAWDGDHGEAGNQGSISTWYFIQLQEKTPVTVYVTPALAMLLTAGLGFLVVVRAQKREREGA
jgi:DMSO reductase family type II enzyme heme b subunit